MQSYLVFLDICVFTKTHLVPYTAQLLQARREAQLQAAHEAAIFGAPVVEDKGTKRRSTWRVREDTGPSKGYSGVDDDTHDNASTKVYGVVSEQVQ